MTHTRHVKAAEILYDPPVLTSSWNSRTARKPDGIPRRGAAGTKTHDSFRNDLGAQIPRLRAFAISLCGSMTLADDLVPGGLAARLGQFGEISAGNKSSRVAVHHSPQRFLFSPSQTLSRGPGQ